MTIKSDKTESSERKCSPKGSCWQMIEQYVEKIKYGSVTVYIQDGKIVQVEKNEKIRFTD